MATGEEPVLQEKASRIRAAADILLYIATIKGTQYALGKIKGYALGPGAGAGEPAAVVFQGGGRLSVAKGYKPDLYEAEAALALAENGEAVTLKPPVGKRSPAGGTADTTLVRGGKGVSFDIKTPESDTADAVFRDVRNANRQAQGVILDLRKTNIELKDLGNVMARLHGAGATNIKEVIVIEKGNTITHLFRVEQ